MFTPFSHQHWIIQSPLKQFPIFFTFVGIMSFLCVSKIVNLLTSDPVVIKSKTQFSHALGTPPGKRKQLEDLYTMGVTSAHDLFLGLLEDWIQRNGSVATLGELGRILRDCQFINVLGKIRSLAGISEQRFI